MIKTGLHQRRFWIGLLLSLVVGIGIQQWLLIKARRTEAEAEARRTAMITVQLLSEIVQRAGAEEEKVAAAVAHFSNLHPEVKNIRAVRGVRLLASTVQSDAGDKVAPRRLSRDEKWIFDTGQRLRAAVQTNREEGVSRKAEVEINRTKAGRCILLHP